MVHTQPINLWDTAARMLTLGEPARRSCGSPLCVRDIKTCRIQEETYGNIGFTFMT